MPYRESSVPRPRKRAFLLELGVMAAAILLLAGILLERLSFYQEMAERANMESTISRLKSGLRIRMAELMIQGRARDYPSLAEENPFDWLDERPANYRGRFPAEPAGALPGSWYYDPAEHALIYLVEHGRHFEPDSQGMKRVRLRVEPVMNPDAVQDATQPAVVGARLVPLESYRWF